VTTLSANVDILARATRLDSVPGFSLHAELRDLVAAGLTPYEALVTATRSPAEFLRRSDVAGTVARGKRAELVLLDANPLVDIAATRGIAGVKVKGRWRDVTALADLRRDLVAHLALE
jgi:imidazolonepropionase-like amidohydrolase